MAKLTRSEAHDRLQRAGVSPEMDFFQLSSTQVEALVEEANRDGYRQPRNANGSRGRYYHARLIRAFNRKS